MCVALSQAAMHSGMVLPVAPPPVMAVPPLVAMTSPWVPMIAPVAGAMIAAVVGAWATAPLVAAFGRIRPLTPKTCNPIVAGVRVVMMVVLGALTASAAKSCVPGLNWLRLVEPPPPPPSPEIVEDDVVTTVAGAVVAAAGGSGTVAVAVGTAAPRIEVEGVAARLVVVADRAAGARAVLGAAALVVVAARAPTGLEEWLAELLPPRATAGTIAMITRAPARTIFEVERLGMINT